MKLLKDIFHLLGAFAAGSVLALCAGVLLALITGDPSLAGGVACGVWFISILLIYQYGELWLNRSKIQQSDPEETMRRLRGSEFTTAFWIGGLGGCSAHVVGAPTWGIVLCVIACAAFGGWIGYDLRRRVRSMLLPRDSEEA